MKSGEIDPIYELRKLGVLFNFEHGKKISFSTYPVLGISPLPDKKYSLKRIINGREERLNLQYAEFYRDNIYVYANDESGQNYAMLINYNLIEEITMFDDYLEIIYKE